MTNIFVGNLSYQTTQEELIAAFSQYGNVERAALVTDRMTGQPRGFAFVEMTNRNEAEEAIARLNGAELHGRTMNVNEARPKPEGGFGGGGGNRPRGNGGGGGGNRGGGSGGGGNRRNPRW
ncbi:MAG: RNA-binding protein [Bryobacteraceae bacterium]|jgi:RNA recognition motif-containing protein